MKFHADAWDPAEFFRNNDVLRHATLGVRERQNIYNNVFIGESFEQVDLRGCGVVLRRIDKN